MLSLEKIVPLLGRMLPIILLVEGVVQLLRGTIELNLSSWGSKRLRGGKALS